MNDSVAGGANFCDSTGTIDTYGHGTSVASIIGAVCDNDMLIDGGCKDVTLVPLKIYSDVTIDNNGYHHMNTSSEDIVTAINYATNNGIHILNCSWGLSYDSDMAQAIVNYPGLVVAAAGNKNNDNDDTPCYPSNYSSILDNVISVAASDKLDAIWRDDDVWGSNFGAQSVDLFAPGSDINVLIPYNPDASYNKYWYELSSGTSLAAPQVAGAAALIMSVRPDMTPAEVKKCIMDSVDKNDNFEGKCVSGGRLNVYKAVQLATQPKTFTGDVNGDGMADMIITRRTSDGKRAIDTYFGQSDGKYNTHITQTFSQTYNYEDPVFIGDVNGDDKPDLIVHTVVNGMRSLIVYRGNYDQYDLTNYRIPFANASQSTPNYSHDYYSTKAKFFIADANGDGKDDFIVHTKNSSGKRINLTYLGLESGAFSSTASTFTSTNNHGTSPVFVGDFNGDGKMDMVVPHATSSKKRCLLVYKGQSSAPYFSAGVKYTSSKNHDPTKWPCQYFVNDVNNDGKDDLVVHWRNANGKRNNLVYKGGSSGLKTEAVTTAATYDDYIAGDLVFVGDINGDGCGDMLVQWANTYNQRNLLVYKGTSSATYGTGTNYNMGDTLDLPERPSCFFFADATGDGRMDFIVKYRSGSGVGNVGFITYAGTASGSFSVGAYSNLSTTDPPYFNN